MTKKRKRRKKRMSEAKRSKVVPLHLPALESESAAVGSGFGLPDWAIPGSALMEFSDDLNKQFAGSAAELAKRFSEFSANVNNLYKQNKGLQKAYPMPEQIIKRKVFDMDDKKIVANVTTGASRRGWYPAASAASFSSDSEILRKRREGWHTSTNPIDYYIIPSSVIPHLDMLQDGIVAGLFLADKQRENDLHAAQLGARAGDGEIVRGNDVPEAAKILIGRAAPFVVGDVVTEPEGFSRYATVVQLEPVLVPIKGGSHLYCAQYTLGYFMNDAAAVRSEVIISVNIFEAGHYWLDTPVAFRGGELTEAMLKGIKLNLQGKRPQTNQASGKGQKGKR